ncbi:hypothetical protein C5S30_00770, partial [ANME-1 cluster archaeon GoMg4]|nr:hypothetical protein [ANME-1 cluster archaeon GoMg4]
MDLYIAKKEISKHSYPQDIRKSVMKSLALLSGGLDSILATKLILDQGIKVVAVTFILPFATEKKDYAEEVAKRFGIPLIKIEACDEYLEV